VGKPDWVRTRPATDHRASARQTILDILLLVLAVFLASWLGLVSRVGHELASFWPTNALLLGIFVRRPRLAMRGASWLAALAGYLLAGTLAGDALPKNLGLTAANLAGVLVGWLLFRALPVRAPALSRPVSMLWVLLACAIAATASALIGGLSAPSMLGIGPVAGFGFWFSAELSSYMILLPAVLLAPASRRLWADMPARAATLRRHPLALLPFATLVASALLAVTLGGPGAIAFPVPALLWCALSYRMFTTSLVTLALCVWLLVAIATGLVDLTGAIPSFQDTISLRIGVALLAVAPLTVAGVNATRNRLMRDLDHVANHDALTGVLTRRAFLRRSREQMHALGERQRPATLLMLDIDHFKQVNDRHGHAAGDDVLTAFAERMHAAMRPSDLLGRFGGEEFAILLPDTTSGDAVRIADRLRRIASAHPIALACGLSLDITVSIGGVSRRCSPQGVQLEDLFQLADRALYEAKAAGRDRVALA